MLRGGDPGIDPTRTTAAQVREADGGADAAFDQLFAFLYDELRQLAQRQRQRWRENYTLNTTALLHEAYVKLADQSRIEVRDRAHFFALAARVMRHILCNYGRDQRALKRGGGLAPLPLEEAALRAAPQSPEQAEGLCALDAALRRLEQIDPRQSRVVECRFFGGLSVEETAAAIGISPRTVKRDWAMAQAWLHREMTADA
jgi:RNA polymerase sigma factor (TIGR02999 family)